MTHADISRIQSRLGWKPRVTIEEGVKEMLSHLKDFKDSPVWTPDKIEQATKNWFAYLRN